MKITNVIFPIILTLIAFFLIYNFFTASSVKSISPIEAKKNLEQNSEIILLDVRTKEEYKEQNIPGSILIPLNNLESTVEKVIPDKKTNIYVYCRTGSRSISAVKILNKLGYENAFNLGGINDWPYEKR